MQIDYFSENLLVTIISNEALRARFLNTLAMMELCGAQKLSRFVNKTPATNFLLEHVAEEYRHAFFLRQLAYKISKGTINSFDRENVFSKRHSVNYLNAIDRRVQLSLDESIPKSRWTYCTYLLTTLVIEHRALPFYQKIQTILDSLNAGMSVKSIVSEEEHHLREIERLLLEENIPARIVAKCHDIEHNSYTAWTAMVANEVSHFVRSSPHYPV